MSDKGLQNTLNKIRGPYAIVYFDVYYYFILENPKNIIIC